MVEGVLAPDKWRDYPHHHGKSKIIRQSLLDARRLFLSNDIPNASYRLGVAFHYIQDAQTSFVWRSPDSVKGQEWHDKYEQWIDDAYFSDDVEKLVKNSFCINRRQMEHYLNFLKLLTSRTEEKENTLSIATYNSGKDSNSDSKWGKPAVDLNFAFQVCLATAKSVLGPKINVELQKEINKMLRDYGFRLRESEQICANKIINLVQRRNKARKAKGFLSFFLATIMSKVFDMRAKSNFKKYGTGDHLLKIAETYLRAATSMARPYIDWYSVTIPSIDINVVEKKLLTIPEALKYLNVDEATLRKMLQKGRPIYNLADVELVQRSDLE